MTARHEEAPMLHEGQERLGEGIYVELNERASGAEIILRLDNGHRVTDTIHLEPAALQALLLFLEREIGKNW